MAEKGLSVGRMGNFQTGPDNRGCRLGEEFFDSFEVFHLHIIQELALIFGVCLAGELAVSLLPVPFPASVAAMVLLMVLLLSGAVKQRQIQNVSQFLTANMGLFFVPSLVGALEHAETLKACLLPFLAVTLLVTPAVYLAAGWSVQLLMRLLRGKGGEKHA